VPSVTRTIAEQTAPAHRVTHGAPLAVPANLTAIDVELASTEWLSKAGAGRVLWGVQLSYDGEVWGPGRCDDEPTNPIGGASLDVPGWLYMVNTIGDMPYFVLPDAGFSVLDHPAIPPGEITGPAGWVRLFAYPEVDIKLGGKLRASWR